MRFRIKKYILFLLPFICSLSLPLSSYDKWIVVTTIQYPTEQLRKLAQIPGWHLVVVGDKKTPSDWHLENCDYLSPQRQLELGYEIAKLLPWNHYSRKNIGYLYAIENGATVIYDTDDDNEPFNRPEACATRSLLPAITTSGSYVNIYAYFGHPNVWPRGFPLAEVLSCNQFYLSNPQECQVGVEQGVVNEAPDVDALFRLTQDKTIIFEKQPPCYLPQGVFCPFNSQNTFFHLQAFFTLYLPSSVTMRVSDIWRSYVSQRLLWEFGQNLVFSGPNAVQKRNEHNIFDDFMLEQDLYLKASQLVNALKKWHNPSNDPFEAIGDLYYTLSKEGFLKPYELLLLEAWLHDLNQIGYQRLKVAQNKLN